MTKRAVSTLWTLPASSSCNRSAYRCSVGTQSMSVTSTLAPSAPAHSPEMPVPAPRSSTVLPRKCTCGNTDLSCRRRALQSIRSLTGRATPRYVALRTCMYSQRIAPLSQTCWAHHSGRQQGDGWVLAAGRARRTTQSGGFSWSTMLRPAASTSSDVRTMYEASLSRKSGRGAMRDNAGRGASGSSGARLDVFARLPKEELRFIHSVQSISFITVRPLPLQPAKCRCKKTPALLISRTNVT